MHSARISVHVTAAVYDRTYLLNKIDLAVVFTKAGSNELVVVQAGPVAQAHCLKSRPDRFEVGLEFVRCIRAEVSYDDLQTTCQKESGPGGAYDASPNNAYCLDRHDEVKRENVSDAKRDGMREITSLRYEHICTYMFLEQALWAVLAQNRGRDPVQV